MRIAYAYDLILIRGEDKKRIACSEPIFDFGQQDCCVCFLSNYQVVLLVNADDNKTFRFAIRNRKIRDEIFGEDCGVVDGETSTCCDDNSHNACSLQKIASRIEVGSSIAARFILIDSNQNVLGTAETRIFLWNSTDRICVMDIDGTITTSSIVGFVRTSWMEDYSCCHKGICSFLAKLVAKGSERRVLYLTSRPIKFVHSTKRLLTSLRQDGDVALPHAPLIGYPGKLLDVLLMEVSKSVHVFKLEALQRHVLKPFGEVGSSDNLWAGFGNTFMDMQAYHQAGISLHRTYIIDKKSRIVCLDRDAIEGVDVTLLTSYHLELGTVFPAGYIDEKLTVHILSSEETNHAYFT